MKKIALVLFSLLLATMQTAFSQAGEQAYRFLSLPSSSHVAALGGANVSMTNNDISFSFHNPALLSTEVSNTLSLNATNYLADIMFGSVAYSHKIDDRNFLAAGVLFVDYGDFTERTEYDEELGTFSATDAAIHLMYGRKLAEKWTIGATLKPIFSSYETYSSFALGVDLGLSYRSDERRFYAGLAFKNIGRQLNGFYKDGSSQHIEKMPFDIQLGFNKQLQHAPFRFSVTAHDLQRWDMGFKSNLTTTAMDGSTELVDNDLSFGENLMRHFIFGVELVPSDNFYLGVGYNYQRGREMKVLENKGLNGFSFGAGLRLKMFHLGFSLAQYTKGSMSYHFSLSTDLNAFHF